MSKADPPPVEETVRQTMQDRNYPEAVNAIEAASAAEDAPGDYLAYLKGRAFHLNGEFDWAVATFEQMEKQFPQSPWVRRARFATAVALARKGDFRHAELIYRAEAEHLLSADRRQQTAEIDLEFADAYFKPADEQVKPDYSKALQFYQKALQAGPKPEKRAEVQLLVARCYQHLDDTSEAAKRYEQFILDHADDPLDIGLIDPDEVFEFKVPGYAKYRDLESRIEVPLPATGEVARPACGVMAVTVSNQQFKATTMVIQSDLDIIVKSSRDEAFVFAQNMRTGKPWPGVRLLLSNGSSVFAEGVTGHDGVLHQTYRELREADDLRVFAMVGGEAEGKRRREGEKGKGGKGEEEKKEGKEEERMSPAVSSDVRPSPLHVASNVISLQGIGVAQGLSDKGYIYTDRPAYRPGSLVEVRGYIRQVVGDVYTIRSGKQYTLEVFDSRNRGCIRKRSPWVSSAAFTHSSCFLPSAHRANIECLLAMAGRRTIKARFAYTNTSWSRCD